MISYYPHLEKSWRLDLQDFVFEADALVRRLFRVVLLWVVVLYVLPGCSARRHDVPKTTTYAVEGTEETYLGTKLSPLIEAHPGKSGFLLVTDGIDALAARMLLARRAEKSIDLQYYLFYNDVAGQLFVKELLTAANRGVRVRILLDDIATRSYSSEMAALDSHPEVEIRIFNPFSRRTGWFLDFMTDLDRANHRMHNKSFTVDNLVTVVGGRNIGAQYFDAKEDINFGDIDLIGFGPVAEQVSSAFDSYWNSEAAVPVMALIEDVSPEDVEGSRRHLLESVEQSEDTPYGKAVRDSIFDYVGSSGELLVWAVPELTVDPIDKIADDFEQSHPDRVANRLRPVILGAQEELLVISPYFVPRDAGVEAFRQLSERNVRVAVVTNSLASNDVIAAHSGYSRYRKDLLEIGVEIWEIRRDKDSDRQQRRKRKLGHSESSLHAKAFIVDNRYVFVGSHNWDPRSSEINTEMGILVDSVKLAAQTRKAFMDRLSRLAYRVRLDADGDVEWVSQDKGSELVYKSEPDTSLFRRFEAGFYKLLPIEDQL